MARGFTTKVEGLKELDQALAQLTKATAKNVMRRALIAAGEPVAERARQLVPVRTGDLRDSIKVTTKTTGKMGAGAFRAALKGGATRAEAGAAMAAASRAEARAGGRSTVEAYIGAGQLPHAHLIEFGTVHAPPQPYLRPAWDEGKQKVLESIRDHLADQIDKAAARAARRAAKRKG